MDMVDLPAWPTINDFPQFPLLDRYSETHPNLTEAKTSGNKSILMRKVATRGQVKLSVSFNFSYDHLKIFEDFFNSILDGGSMLFVTKHPRKGIDVIVSFDSTQKDAYTIRPNGSTNFWVVDASFIVWG